MEKSKINIQIRVNLETDNGRSFVNQQIQNPVVPVKPIRSVITFSAALILFFQKQNCNTHTNKLANTMCAYVQNSNYHIKFNKINNTVIHNSLQTIILERHIYLTYLM